MPSGGIVKGVSDKSLGLCTLFLLLVCTQLMSRSVSHPEFGAAPARVVAEALQPVQRLHHELLATTRFFRDRYFWLVAAAEQRDALVAEVTSLKQSNSMLQEYGRENVRLRKLLSFSNDSKLHGVVASVIGRDSSAWVKSVTINKGSAHGVRSGLAVIADGVLVGRTTRVSPRSSRVLLISDHISSVDVLIQETRLPGIVQGAGVSTLSLEYVETNLEEPAQLGQTIITSGLDGVFPKGLVVGEISSIDGDESSMFQNIKVSAYAKFQMLEEVQVLLPELETPSESLFDELSREKAFKVTFWPECSEFFGG